MKPDLRLLSLGAAAAVLACGCSLSPDRIGPSPEAERIGVYESFPPGRQDYRFVKRLWVDPWQSAIRVPLFASVESGVAELRSQAVALGGDAIVNFGCYHIAVDPASDYVCNGTVVKFLP